MHECAGFKKKDSNERKLTIGGGCFWCTEAVFQLLKGVSKVESGYSGGSIHNPTYREVCSGRTGHAEVVQVTYDPEVIALADLLRIHLSTHNPTTLNRQGADKGTQYRSIIFYRDEQEKTVAEDVTRELQSFFEDSIVTELQPFTQFYKADEAHQDYYKNNIEERYCQAVIAPKLEKFRELFADKLKDKEIIS